MDVNTYLNPSSIKENSISWDKMASFTVLDNSTSTSRSATLQYGTCTKIVGAAINNLSISFNGGTAEEYGECLVEFDASSSNFTFTYPDTVRWVNNIPPLFQAGWHYQISFTHTTFDNTTYILGICVGFPK